MRLSKILYINNNNFHNLGRSQMCAGGCSYFRPSKPHSGTLWLIFPEKITWKRQILPKCTLPWCLHWPCWPSDLSSVSTVLCSSALVLVPLPAYVETVFVSGRGTPLIPQMTRINGLKSVISKLQDPATAIHHRILFTYEDYWLFIHIVVSVAIIMF